MERFQGGERGVSRLIRNDGPAVLTETHSESRLIYEGRILNLRVDKVSLPDGRIASREVVEHKPAVVIIAESDRGELLLIRQFRYPVRAEMLELPAGIVEPGEDHESAAIRELQEETGWRPDRIAKVTEVYSSPGFTDELFIIYYATNLRESRLPCDDDEFIVPMFASRKQVEELIAQGRIDDGKTLLGVYWWLYDRKCRGERSA